MFDPARTLKIAALPPTPVGLNTTLIVQLFFPASDEPQLLVWSKSPPIMETLTPIAELPVLVRVAGLTALLLVTAVLGNDSKEGERLCACVFGTARNNTKRAKAKLILRVGRASCFMKTSKQRLRISGAF